MSYKFIPNARYRMPTHFGPMYGPRNIPEGVVLDHTRFPLSTSTAEISSVCGAAATV